jgi:hypothetical protein
VPQKLGEALIGRDSRFNPCTEGILGGSPTCLLHADVTQIEAIGGTFVSNLVTEIRQKLCFMRKIGETMTQIEAISDTFVSNLVRLSPLSWLAWLLVAQFHRLDLEMAALKSISDLNSALKLVSSLLLV